MSIQTDTQTHRHIMITAELHAQPPFVSNIRMFAEILNSPKHADVILKYSLNWELGTCGHSSYLHITAYIIREHEQTFNIGEQLLV